MHVPDLIVAQFIYASIQEVSISKSLELIIKISNLALHLKYLFFLPDVTRNPLQTFDVYYRDSQ